MKILRSGDANEQKAILAKHQWIGSQLQCENCRCCFELEKNDRHKIQCETHIYISFDEHELHRGENEHTFYTHCPKCLSEIEIFNTYGENKKAPGLLLGIEKDKTRKDKLIERKLDREKSSRLKQDAHSHLRLCLPVIRELERLHRIREFGQKNTTITLTSGKKINVEFTITKASSTFTIVDDELNTSGSIDGSYLKVKTKDFKAFLDSDKKISKLEDDDFKIENFLISGCYV